MGFNGGGGLSGPITTGAIPPNLGVNSQLGIINSNGSINTYNGPKNYISHNNFENNATTGWSLGTIGTLTNSLPTGTPTFGSGASGNLSISTTASQPISGNYSLAYNSTAATTVGDMLASQTYTIETSDNTHILTWSLSYLASSNPSNVNYSGTSSNSFAVAIWDATNSAWIPSTGNFGMTQGGSNVGFVSGTVQLPVSTASIQFIIYNANATAGAVTMYFDQFFLGPQTAPTGYAGTDWQDYPSNAYGTLWTATGTAGTYGTVVSHKTQWRRVGANMEIREDFTNSTAGTAGTGMLLLSLPPGYSIDTTKAPGNTTVASTSAAITATVGSFTAVNGATIAMQGGVQVYDSTHLKIVNITATSNTSGAGAGYFGGGGYTSFAAGNTALGIFASIPIAGWSSNVQMSNDTDTRVVAARAHVSTGASTTAGNPFNYDVVDFDTHGAITVGTTTWNYKVPVSGFYRVSTTNFASNLSNIYYLYKNGVAFTVLNYITFATGVVDVPQSGSSTTVQCSVGDTLNIVASATATPAAPSGPTVAQSNWVSIERLSGPSVIAATESVNMRYTNTAGTSIANSGDVNVPFATKDFDSHNAYNTSTGLYTVPVSGKYAVTGTVNYASSTYGVNNQVIASVYKNTAIHSYGDIAPIMAIVTLPFGSNVSTTVNCLAGDTLEIRAQNTRTAGATTLNTGAGFNHIEIERIGN